MGFNSGFKGLNTKKRLNKTVQNKVQHKYFIIMTVHNYFMKRLWIFWKKIVASDCILYYIDNSRHITRRIPFRFCMTVYLYTYIRATDMRLIFIWGSTTKHTFRKVATNEILYLKSQTSDQVQIKCNNITVLHLVTFYTRDEFLVLRD